MVGRETTNPLKIEFVKELADDINKRSIIGIIDVTKMPSAALQKIKYELHGKAEIKSLKKSLLLRSIEMSDKKNLKDYVTGQPCILLTEMNPFKLYKIVKKSKSKVAAKPGNIAPNDIKIQAGPTEIPPGPAISTLSKIGLKPKVEGATIAIMKDKVVCKAGEEVSETLAPVLNMLNIKPIEVGLTLIAVLEDDVIYTTDILDVDEKQTLNNMISGYHHAINLSLETGFIIKEAIPIMITKAFNEARSLALETGIVSKDVIGELLAKAVAEMGSLEKEVGELKTEEPPKEETKEEISVKENKDEVKTDGKKSYTGEEKSESTEKKPEKK